MIKFFERRVEKMAFKLLKHKKLYAWVFLVYAMFNILKIGVTLYKFYREFYDRIPWYRYFSKKKLQE